MLRSRVHPLVADFAVSIEHVDSTAVVDLAAKPIIEPLQMGLAGDIHHHIPRRTPPET